MDNNPYKAPQSEVLAEGASVIAAKRRWRNLFFVAFFLLFAYRYGIEQDINRTFAVSFAIAFIVCAIGTAISFVVPRLEKQMDRTMRIVCPLTILVGSVWWFFGW